MAQFKTDLPKDLIKQFERLDLNCEKMIGDMVEAGARATMDLVRAKMPRALSEVVDDTMLTLSNVYKTPSDDGINCQVVIDGYFINRNGVKTPAPLVANMFEYGSSLKRYQNYPKQPFFRQSFNKAVIEKAMIKVQDKYIKEA